MAKSFQYNDGLQNAGRKPNLWMVFQGKIHTFAGVGIPGIVAIASDSWKKAGKWSSTTYQLELPDSATPCLLLAAMHNRLWPENDRMTAYQRFMKEFSVVVSFDEFDTALARDYAEARERMIQGEQSLESIETETGLGEQVEISTYQPNNRTPHSDVRVKAPDGREWVIAHDAPKGTDIPGVCKLIDIKFTPGYRGGTTTLVFAVAHGNIIVSVESYYKDDQPHPWALGRGGDGVPPQSQN